MGDGDSGAAQRLPLPFSGSPGACCRRIPGPPSLRAGSTGESAPEIRLASDAAASQARLVRSGPLSLAVLNGYERELLEMMTDALNGRTPGQLSMVNSA